MRCVVTGTEGQLGRCLVRRIQQAPDHDLVFAADHAACDLADAASVDRLFEPGRGELADVLFNAAAYTAVDRCETDFEAARVVNATGASRLAAHCHEKGVLLVHVSTDYVFAGDADSPYSESAEASPVNAYGRTKLEGEEGVLAVDPSAIVVRTSWVFGPGRNFVAAILDQARKRRSGEVAGPLSVVDDQIGSPTNADHLAGGLIALAERALTRGEPSMPPLSGQDGEPVQGLYHLTGAGHTTWWGFARAILDRTGHTDLEIDPMKTGSLALPAARPAYSVLDTSRAASLGIELPAWEQGLGDYLASPEGAALQGVGV